MALITMDYIKKLSPVFSGPKGDALAAKLLRLTGIDLLSERYSRREDLSGPAFVDAFLKDLDVNYQLGGLEHLAPLNEGPFITVCNHPYGALDGLILIDLIGHIRSDFKVMANQFLSVVQTIKDCFISVVPNTNDTFKATKESISGLRQTIVHLHGGHPMGIFPAGAVSDFSFRCLGVQDREWQDTAIRLIQKMKVPVVPIRFFDRNSALFYFLGLLHWKLRTLRLPKEVLNKGGKTVRVGIGPIISVEKQQENNEIKDLGRLLRDSVYRMELPKQLIRRDALDVPFSHFKIP